MNKQITTHHKIHDRSFWTQCGELTDRPGIQATTSAPAVNCPGCRARIVQSVR